MFKKGSHHVNVRVGYYTQILGLGDKPTDVTLSSLSSPEGCGNSLCNFWRGAENLQLNSHTKWAVSQASPLRRMQINNNLDLHDRGWVSGGYIGDLHVTGTIGSGSQ